MCGGSLICAIRMVEVIINHIPKASKYSNKTQGVEYYSKHNKRKAHYFTKI